MKKKTLLNFILISFSIILIVTSCQSSREIKEHNPNSLWTFYNKDFTNFKLWSPKAEMVKLKLYKDGFESSAFSDYEMIKDEKGVWRKTVDGDLNGTYYTFQVKYNGKWLDETPGIYAAAVGVNGKRAMVLDFKTTDPEGWIEDNGPEIDSPNDAVIYEMHVRDFTILPESGSSYPGKFIGISESGTKYKNEVKTGLDHLVELGITHIHLLPSFDYFTIDETRLDSAQFNWGYDPQNYNVPEGSYSTDPFKAEVRIKEFKEMVKKLHDAGIGVILDVVYNHTSQRESSNFNLEYPGYFYRYNEDGTYSNSSGCGNETASEKPMMRDYIIESLKHWAKEYHIDGFRFDLMGIHDIVTMNEVAEELKSFDQNIFVYGEGWTAGDSPLPLEERALKAHMQKMPSVSAFSDDIRDGLKGSVFEDESTGFVSGAKNTEESIKFGVVGSIKHQDINYKDVNYSNEPWTLNPWQAVSYVSCHDNHTLFDKLNISAKNASKSDIIKMHKLANAIVLTSQGISFIHAGSEMLRTKNGEHNSYNLSDEINRIDWQRKIDHKEVFEYYKNLITLRKNHPAFRMQTGDDVRKNLKFIKSENGLISYQISNNANGDLWKNIIVIYNARKSAVNYAVQGEWNISVLGDKFEKKSKINKTVKIPPISMAILYQK